MTPVKRQLDYQRRDERPSTFGLAAGLVVSAMGIVPLLLGMAWLYTFILTDYRAHHRPVMIPLGLIATGIGLAMVIGPWLARWYTRGFR